MVDSNLDESQIASANVGEPLELHHFYRWNDYTDEVAECDEEKA